MQWRIQWEQRKHSKNGVIHRVQSADGVVKGKFQVLRKTQREALGTFQKTQNVRNLSRNGRNETMKRAIIFVLLLLMVLSLVACGGTSTPTPTPEPTPKPSPEPVYKIGETISTDNTELTIHDAKFAYYLSSVQSVGKPSEKYITPYEDESKRGTDTFYTASTGHSFVWLSCIMK